MYYCYLLILISLVVNVLKPLHNSLLIVSAVHVWYVRGSVRLYVVLINHVITLPVSLYCHDPFGHRYMNLSSLYYILTTHVCQSSYAQYTCYKVCVQYNYNTLLDILLPAASPFSASQFLKTYEDEFVEVVNAKQSLLKLKHKGVISQAVRASIEGTNEEEEATYILLEHLEKNATVDTLREYCKVAIAADGYPRMQELGRKMIDALPPEG